jgi:hypothetical protein
VKESENDKNKINNQKVREDMKDTENEAENKNRGQKEKREKVE